MTVFDLKSTYGAYTIPYHLDADTINRAVKMAIDTGEVPSVEAGYDLFRSYRLAVVAGPELGTSAAHQAALLTIVNTARRALLGGVEVAGGRDVPLRVPFVGADRLDQAVGLLGGRVVAAVAPDIPTLTLGTVDDEVALGSPSLAITFGGWRGGAIPTAEHRRLGERDTVIPAAVLAGAVGVAEVFQHLRGNPMAGRRAVGLSLWSPGRIDWEGVEDGPTSIVFPSRLWLVGLGHLGQAYLWTLGLLPYENPGDVELVLQDFDRLTLANDSTSLLTSPGLVGRRKTRAMAEWAEARGFRTSLVERLFPGGIKVVGDEPRLALGGVDNAQARAAYEDAGFDCVVEAGLGAGPTEYLALRIHTFPASTTAREKWGGARANPNKPVPETSAYADLAASGMDACGLVRLATRTVGAPFVGATAAALVIAEVLRRLNGGSATEVLDMTLRDVGSRAVVATAAPLDRFNPGYTR